METACKDVYARQPAHIKVNMFLLLQQLPVQSLVLETIQIQRIEHSRLHLTTDPYPFSSSCAGSWDSFAHKSSVL